MVKFGGVEDANSYNTKNVEKMEFSKMASLWSNIVGG